MARTKQASRVIKQKKASDPNKARKHRWKSGTVALRQVRGLQTGRGKYRGARPNDDTRLLIPRMSFRRLVKSVTQDLAAAGDIRAEGDVRFKQSAISALQHAAEAHITELMADAQDYALHARHETVGKTDLALAHWKRTVPGPARDLKNCPVHWKVPRKPGLVYKRFQDTKPTGMTLAESVGGQKNGLTGKIVPNDDEGDETDSQTAE